ncbi:hypothetical protein [Bosea robiniae]|uniref:Uncharacterized protein n=1 Tax=Bosea robiniae TaxID=1036780 RepID=A0ABY0NGH4_9HYPH|nr:hypothetical protein [Bosea robiniae]SDF29416.1 hypothetical protein SAMN05421844_101268 [Bosea robiniae]
MINSDNTYYGKINKGINISNMESKSISSAINKLKLQSDKAAGFQREFAVDGVADWYAGEVRSIVPNVCFTLTGYFPNWRPHNGLASSDAQLVRRQFARFYRKLGIALSPEKFDRRNVENWPLFYAFVETQQRGSKRPVPAHIHAAAHFSELQLAWLGDGTGREGCVDARKLWLETIGAYRDRANESYSEAYARQKRLHNLFQLDLNPDENTSFYITKFSGLEENAARSIRRSDLLCLSGH